VDGDGERRFVGRPVRGHHNRHEPQQMYAGRRGAFTGPYTTDIAQWMDDGLASAPALEDDR